MRCNKRYDSFFIIFELEKGYGNKDVFHVTLFHLQRNYSRKHSNIPVFYLRISAFCLNNRFAGPNLWGAKGRQAVEAEKAAKSGSEGASQEEEEDGKWAMNDLFSITKW